VNIDYKIMRVASGDRDIVEDGLADDLIDFVRQQRDDFTHEVHYLYGPSVMVEFTFSGGTQPELTRLAVLLRLVFGGIEVALVWK
jgi:hypothetical protein